MPGLIEILQQVLGASPAAAGTVPQAPPRTVPRMLEGMDSPVYGAGQVVPAPRRATLPAGSFTPQAEAAPAPAPEPAAAMPMQQTQSMTSPQNPIMALLSGGGAGGDFRQMLRAAGAGMANLGRSGGDPFVSFGQGMGGATSYYDAQDAATAAAQAKAEDTAYERAQDEAKTAREIENDEADRKIRELAEARQAKTAELTNQKTALEIKREARMNGVTTSQMLEIERIAQAAGEGLWNEDRTRAIEDTRKRLIDQFTADKGITERSPGLSSQPTATGPNGEKAVLVNGKWEIQ